MKPCKRRNQVKKYKIHQTYTVLKDKKIQSLKQNFVVRVFWYDKKGSKKNVIFPAFKKKI